MLLTWFGGFVMAWLTAPKSEASAVTPEMSCKPKVGWAKDDFFSRLPVHVAQKALGTLTLRELGAVRTAGQPTCQAVDAEALFWRAHCERRDWLPTPKQGAVVDRGSWKKHYLLQRTASVDQAATVLPRLLAANGAASLVELNLTGHCPLPGGALLRAVERCTHLRRLRVTSTHLPTLARALGKLGGLEEVELYGAQEPDILSAVTKARPDLRALTLRRVSLNAAWVEHLPRFSGLERLRLQECTFDAHAIAHLPRLVPWLRHLSIVSCQLSVLPSAVGHLQGLQRLDVSDNRLRSLPVTLSHLRDLRWLNISYNAVSAHSEPLRALLQAGPQCLFIIAVDAFVDHGRLPDHLRAALLTR